MAGRQSEEMNKAQRAVTSGKMTATEAARKYGVSRVSIYSRPWYKEWRAGVLAAEKAAKV